MRYLMLKKALFFWFVCCIAKLSAVCNPYGIPAYKSGYIPFVIINNSNVVPDSNIYVTITGTDPTTDLTCMVQFSTDSGQYVGSLVDATSTPAFSVQLNTLQYSYLLSSIPNQKGQRTVYLPPITNATLYLSVGYPMGLQTGTSSMSTPPYPITPPQLFTVTDSNFYHLYDNSIFFSIGLDLNLQVQELLGFNLPVSAMVSINGGTSLQFAGITSTRSTILSNYNNSVSNLSGASQTQWQTLPISFTSASGSGPTLLRLASLTSAMSFVTPLTPFDITYLFNDDYGADWISTVFGVNNVYFDVSALPPQGSDTYTTYQYTGIETGNLTFVSNGTAGTDVLIPYGFTTSLPFLNAAPTGVNSFGASGDALAAPLICGYLSAGFVSGLFPVTDTAQYNPFSNSYLALANFNNQIYQNNSAFTGSGPWYDLYGAALHSAARGTSYFNFEADVADADMGFFAPVVVHNNSNSQPSVFVVVGDCSSTVVPNFTDTSTYQILIAVSDNTTVTLNGAAAPVGQTPVTIPFTLGITYNTGNFNGYSYTCQVWLNDPTQQNYSVVFPQPPGVITPSYTGSLWNIAIPDSPTD